MKTENKEVKKANSGVWAGIVAGAVLFPLIQGSLETLLVKNIYYYFAPASASVLLLPLTPLGFALEFTRILQSGLWFLVTYDAVVGALGGSMRLAWLKGDRALLRRLTVLSYCLLTYCGLRIAYALYMVFAFRTYRGVREVTLFVQVPLNLLLLCSIALTVAGTVASKRLQTS